MFEHPIYPKSYTWSAMPGPVNLSLSLLCLTLIQTTLNNRTIPSKFTLLLNSTHDHLRFIVCSFNSDLFIAIRSPVSVPDFLTFLDFPPSPFLKHSIAHTGALKSAKIVINQSSKLLENFHGRVHFTGHCLGGSIAIIAVTILRVEHKFSKLSVVTFGSFPSISADLDNEMYPFVTTFVLNRDRIPDLTLQSWKTISDSISECEPPKLKEGSLLYKLVENLADTFLRGSGLKGRIKQELAHIAAKFVENVQIIREKDLFINPGAVFRIRMKGDEAVVNFFERETVDSIFTLINGLEDHEIVKYRTALTLSMKTVYPVPRPR
jgi:hypothetical protein